jgi:hypothetical protein
VVESDSGGLDRLRSRLSRNRLRLLFALLIVVSAAFLAYSSTTTISTASEENVPRAPATDNHTVITESGRVGTITAYRPNGSVLYYDNNHTKYFDIDPTADDPLTVEYVATDTISTAGPTCEAPPCARNLLKRTDLRTGETEVLFERYEHKEFAGEWHDIDRINETHVAVANIADDEVFVVNTGTGVVTWEWHAQSEFPLSGGGPYPRDWSHINDVELLEDGRLMVSLRNQDQVVFIDRREGVQANWTLGAEDDYDVMYEQHNPDYIPAEDGGPAVVLADSENGRVQEFQREDGEWVRTWEWADDRMQWPRDADRLPNGNTLVVDTHGNRVMEISPEGAVVWQVESTLPYDAERLETGDESAGESARSLGLRSQTSADDPDEGFSPFSAMGDVVTDLLPHWFVNGVLFVSPVWMESPQFFALGTALGAGLTWLALEGRWWLSERGVRLRWPVVFERQ